MKNKFKTIGILGGMGPEASANLYQEIIKYFQKKYNAVQDYDYPPMIIYNLPLLGFDETGIVDKSLVKNQLIDGVKKLENAGCDFIIIACNTVHYFFNELEKSIDIPILSIIEEAKKEVIKAGFKTVGLLASESTNKLNLYQDALDKAGVKVISANKQQQAKINLVIENIMGGNNNEQDVNNLKEIINSYVDNGAEATILGCTEIPLAIKQKDTNIKLFNTINVIVEAAVDFSLRKGNNEINKNKICIH